MRKTVLRVGVVLAVVTMTAVAGAVLTLGILVNRDTPDHTADAAACKAAMGESNTGIVQWKQDKATRPEACRDLDEATFEAAADEWYDEFYREAGEVAAK
jgi:hypothetical protein